MSFYPLSEDCEVPIFNSNSKIDINTTFWEQIVTCTEEEFEEFVSNHPWNWNVIQVESKECKTL